MSDTTEIACDGLLTVLIPRNRPVSGLRAQQRWLCVAEERTRLHVLRWELVCWGGVNL